MRDDLRRQLRELGVVKGVRELAALPAPRRVAIEDLVPGCFHTTPHGQCFVAETTYPPDHRHGDLPLSSFLELPTEAMAQVARDSAFAGVDLGRSCFLDTETTGLSGGTGTMAFVVGLGFFAEDGFHVRQYFLRDPGDEPVMVEALAELLPQFEALVSFNGRAFDVPILENRFILARTPPPMAGVPHLDLLGPARRLWRYRLQSCALGALERAVLGVLREQDDVPSGEIPYLYRDYLRTGDAREMQRVLYHNTVDILSLTTLAARLCQTFADPWAAAEGETKPEEAGEGKERLSDAEFFGLGSWYAAEGWPAEAERAYRAALRLRTPRPRSGQALRPRTLRPPFPRPCLTQLLSEQAEQAGQALRQDSGRALQADLTPDLRAKVLRALGTLLKQADRRAEAFAYWQQLALEAAPDTADFLLAHVELAKYFEWHVENLPLAAGWTRVALECVGREPAGMHRDVALAELHHRLARLERKMGEAKAQSPNSKPQGADA